MERQNYSSNPTRMDLDSATGVSARRTGVHLPPARQLLELRGSRGQEIPRNPASRQTGQPGDRAAGGARREGRGTPWAAGACCREARAEREPEPEQGPPEREQAKAGCLQDPRITFYHGCRRGSHNSCRQRNGVPDFLRFPLVQMFLLS